MSLSHYRHPFVFNAMSRENKQLSSTPSKLGTSAAPCLDIGRTPCPLRLGVLESSSAQHRSFVQLNESKGNRPNKLHQRFNDDIGASLRPQNHPILGPQPRSWAYCATSPQAFFDPDISVEIAEAIAEEPTCQT